MEKERAMEVVLLFCLVVVMELPEASATRYVVGGNMGWTNNVNYTIWTQDKHFYNGDWLFFVYDRNQMDVLEVNQTNYVSCNAEHPLHNWTTGAGRDVVPLNVTRHYYFISSKGFCSGGMKVAVKVENMPPPPKAAPVSKSSAPSPAFKVENMPPPPEAAPVKSKSSTPSPAFKVENMPPPPKAAPVKSKSCALTPAFRSQFVLPAGFAIGALWDALGRL